MHDAAPVAWRRTAGIWATYRLEDRQLGTIRKISANGFVETRSRQWVIPVFLGRRKRYAFWWYRDFVYRCDPGLRWWDIQAIAAAASSTVGGAGVARWPVDPLPRLDRTDPVPQNRRSFARRLREHGIAGSFRRLATRARAHLYLDETHVWFELRLPPEEAAPMLPPSVVLDEGGAADLDSFKDLPTPVSMAEGERRLLGGTRLRLLKEEGAVVSAAWIFTGQAPAAAAIAGRLTLPTRVAVLEDVATAERHRGRGLGPAAWRLIAADLAHEGLTSLLMKVEIGNGAGRRAARKAGFTEAAVVRTRRLGRRQRVRITPLGSAVTVRLLREQLR